MILRFVISLYIEAAIKAEAIIFSIYIYNLFIFCSFCLNLVHLRKQNENK